MESQLGRGSGAAAGRRKPEVKVTYIITTEVSADEASFKDVVQRLTGKDSAPARAAVLLANNSAAPPALGPSRVVNNGDAVAGDGGGGGGGSAGGVGRGSAAPPSSFEGAMAADAAGALPSLEEMTRWWGTQHD